MRLLAVLAFAACGTPPATVQTSPDAAAPSFVDDPGLDGAPFTLADPTCVTVSDHVECGTTPGNELAYSTVGTTTLHLDLYAPVGATHVPVIVYVHGGGWLSGTWHDPGLDVAGYLAQGYAVVSVEYRLTADPFPAATGFQFPDNLQDLKTAIRWLRIKASGIVDSDRILAYGFSAGAHLVSVLDMTAGVAEFEGRGDPTVSSTPTATVGLSTPIDFHLFFPSNPALDPACPSQPPPGPGGTPADGVALLLGVAPTDFESLASSPKLDWVSAISYLDAHDPPLLMFAGTCDQTVPYHGAEVALAAAQQVGAPVDLFISQGSFHGGTLQSQAAKDKLAAFITTAFAP